ncbi:hypothetical protein SADUNF_Sadunf13G0081900 [Salix dunnii]|uniref:Uncharacterized protein n=1 Tax=Salix dunnii TaxID=1413687 RepID=A0A835JG39_9ROSI|nr:hypothetical protein SADUNF_Sadunf13G0081900 [Salix dunnii]
MPWKKSTDKDLELRITKRLFQTDMNEQHDRLSMLQNQIKDLQGFLNDEEKRNCPNTNLKIMASRRSCLIWPALTVFIPGHDDEQKVSDTSAGTMRLRKWDMKNSSPFILFSNKKVLKESDIVQIYSFKRNENLCGSSQGKNEDGAST